jgi:hypothetical protein
MSGKGQQNVSELRERWCKNQSGGGKQGRIRVVERRTKVVERSFVSRERCGKSVDTFCVAVNLFVHVATSPLDLMCCARVSSGSTGTGLMSLQGGVSCDGSAANSPPTSGTMFTLTFRISSPAKALGWRRQPHEEPGPFHP